MAGKIIINADDFGLNFSCTKAIGEAFQKKLITDTTMVANGSAFPDAIHYIAQLGLECRVGIHFNLTEGVPLTKKILHLDAFCENGRFHGSIHRQKRLSSEEKIAIYDELSAQVRKLQDADIQLTHADSHHHIHTGIFIAPIVVAVCKRYGLKKIRLHRNIGVINLGKRYVKKIYNFWLNRQGFLTTDCFGSCDDAARVECGERIVEVMVHPGYDAAGKLIDITEYENDNPKGKSLEESVSCIGILQLSSYYEL